MNSTILILAILALAVLLTCICAFIGRRVQWKKCVHCRCHYTDHGDISYSSVSDPDTFPLGTCPNCHKNKTK